MNRFGKAIFVIAVACLSLSGVSGVAFAGNGAKPPGPQQPPADSCQANIQANQIFKLKKITFPICAYAASVKAQLTGKVVGYSWAALQNGLIIGEGAGGQAIVVPSMAMAPSLSMDVFSMSKTVTATAVMKAMEKLKAGGSNISVNSKILPFLPSNWVPGPHVADMTFRDVLTHGSGLRSHDGVAGTTPCFYENLKTMIALGSTDANWHKAQYDNANYCLLRVVVAYMVKGAAHYKPFEKANGGNDLKTGQDYVTFCKEALFKPLNIPADIVPPTAFYIHYYSFKDTTKYLGEKSEYNDTIDGGASYWNLTAPHFASFIWNLEQGKIVSLQSFATMRDTTSPDPAANSTRLGMYQTVTPTATWYGHDGGVAPTAEGVGATTVWQLFPDNVVLVLYINSNGGLNDANGNGRPAFAVTEAAYHAATGK